MIREAGLVPQSKVQPGAALEAKGPNGNEDRRGRLLSSGTIDSPTTVARDSPVNGLGDLVPSLGIVGAGANELHHLLVARLLL